MNRCVRFAGVFGFTLAVAAAMPSAALAQCAKGRTHRPVEDLFASDVVYLQEQGEVQFELKPARTREHGLRTATLEADVEYGPRDWWQIETEWDAREWRRQPDGTVSAGVGDVAVGSRVGWRCIGGSPYHLSAGMDVSVPSEFVHATGETARRVGLVPSIIVAREVGRIAHLFSAMEVDARVNRRRPGIADWTYSSDTGMFVRVVRGFRGTAELSIEGGPGEERDVHFVPGVLWHRGDAVEIGVGMLAPVSHGASRGVLAHVVCEFGGRHEAR